MMCRKAQHRTQREYMMRSTFLLSSYSGPTPPPPPPPGYPGQCGSLVLFLFFLTVLFLPSVLIGTACLMQLAGEGWREENPNKSKIYSVFKKTKNAGLSVKDINFIKNRGLKEKNLNADREWDATYKNQHNKNLMK
jgi:hypothetical protein